MVIDPISDFLTRVRNASRANLAYAVIPASKLKIAMTQILEAEGFIRGFRLIKDNGQGKIKIALRYTEAGAPVIKGLQRVSKPSARVYKPSSSVKKVAGGLGVAIVSTSKGLLTDAQARQEKVGGEVLANVW